MSTQFLLRFFQFVLPEPGERYPAGPDAKSDLKLLLEIATNSRLKQGQDKKNQNKQIFYCRSLGKDCFKIEVEFLPDGSYTVLDDYNRMRHKEGCEKSGESPNVIKIYNLMMLKRTLIEDFMDRYGLAGSSPETILQKISGDSGEYFYCDSVPDLESRRKLKKRFDNIINISIKKKRELREDLESSSKAQKEQKAPRKGKARKNSKASRGKQNEPKVTFCQKQNNSKASLFNELKEEGTFIRPRRRAKMESNSSIFFRNNENDEQKPHNPSEIFPVKADSLFEEEQEDYFKKNSDMHIALNMLNDMGSHNYWPESDNSIGRGGELGDRMRVDDLFASLIRNSLLRSLERKSLGEIDYSITDSMPNPTDNNS